MGKVKCHELRKVTKSELLKQLEELKQELSEVCLIYIGMISFLLVDYNVINIYVYS